MIRIFQISVLAALVLAGNAFAADAPPNYTPGEIRQLCFKLSSNDDAVRWKAARELKDAGSQATDMLCTILQGEWLEGRKLAAYVLGQIKDPAAILPLASCLGDKEFHVRWKCAVSLVAIGEQAVPQLVRVLRTGNLESQYCAAWALGEIKDPRGVLALAETATAEDDDLRWKSVISLKRICPAAVQELKRLLKDDSVRARSCAVWALDQLGGQNVVEPLLSAADDPAEEVRRRVAEALVKFDRPDVRKALEKLVTDKSPDVRRQAIRSLTRLGKEAADAEFEDDATPLWAPKELTYKPEEPAANAQMKVTLLAPSQKKHTVFGFEQNGLWLARFAPDETGEWFYTIDYSAGEKAAVEHGMFTCSGSQLPPALSIEPEPRPHLMAGGQAIFLVEAPVLFAYPLAVQPWKLLLEKCGRQGFNLIRLDLPVLFDACRQAKKTDLQRWNLLDQILNIAHQNGVYVLVTLFNENEIRNNAFWERSPYNSKNGGPIPADGRFPLFYDPISRQIGQMQNAYLRETLLRTQCHANVLFELCRGFNTEGSAIPYARGWLILRLKNFANTPRPLVLSAAEGNERLFKTDGIDIAGLQAGADLSKIALPHLALQKAPDDPAEAVAAAWHAALEGAAIAGWDATAAGDFEAAVKFADEAENRPAVLTDFARNRKLQEMKPGSAFVLSVPPQLRASALIGDRQMLLFVSGSAEGGEAVRIGMPAGEYSAVWLDTRSGKKIATDTFGQNDGAIEVNCPRFTEGAVCEVRAK